VPKITSRHEYIFSLIFSNLYQIDYGLTDRRDDYIASQKSKINYSQIRIDENEIFISPNGLLENKGISEVEINVQKKNNIPIFFATIHKDSYFFDFFAASFYLVSRYEEYLPHLKDKYNRYKAEESLAFRNGFLERPIINIWAKEFIDRLQNQFPDLNITPSKFKYISTIDIDNAYLYKGRGLVRSMAFLLKAIINSDFKTIKLAFLVMSRRIKDPFDTYSLQFNLQRKYNIEVIYFILLADYGLNDKNISHYNSQFQILIKRLADFAHVGVHPSYASNTNKDKLGEEIKRLEMIQKRETTSSRQHFLQLSLPATYIDLIKAGITDDYTMGYGSHLGFRAGIANSFLFYNLDTEQIMPINVHPFAISDEILKFSLQLDPINVVDNVAHIIDEVKEVNGTLISLWHNDTFSNIGVWKGWRNVYEDVLKQIQL